MNKARELRSLRGRIFAELSKKKSKNKCLYVNDSGIKCINSAISSHTIQRNGALRDIAESSHVHRISPSMIDEITGRRPVPQFKKIGLSNASVFPGFCEDHDQEIFGTIENSEGEITNNDLILLGYRSICMELFKKQRSATIYRKPDIEASIRKLGIDASASAFLAGTDLAIKDLQEQKKLYDIAINKGHSLNLWASYFTLESTLPFCYASSFAPEFGFDGKLILPRPDKKWGTVSVFAGNLKGKSILAFVGFDVISGHDIQHFFTSQNSITPKKIGGIALHLAIEHSENTYFRITWADNLMPEIKNELLTRFGAGVPGVPNSHKENLKSQFDVVLIKATDFVLFSA